MRSHVDFVSLLFVNKNIKETILIHQKNVDKIVSSHPENIANLEEKNIVNIKIKTQARDR